MNEFQRLKKLKVTKLALILVKSQLKQHKAYPTWLAPALSSICLLHCFEQAIFVQIKVQF